MTDDVSNDLNEEIGEAVASSGSPSRMAINVYETDEALVVVGAVPGLQANDLTASVSDGQLTISARLRSAAPKDYLIREWDYGALERTLDLPSAAGLPATASVGNGQLAISLTLGSSETGDIEIGSS